MWSKKDLKWLAANYPAVKVKPGGVLEGTLVFRMLFRDGNRYVNPTSELLAEGEGTFTASAYNVRVVHKGKKEFPKTFETGGKIQAVADKKVMKMIDLHIYPDDGALCLASPMVTYPLVANGFSLQQYVEDFLIPYLFAQQYFDKNEHWPWGDLSHGVSGHLEWLSRIDHPSAGDVNIALAHIQTLVKGEHFEELFSVRSRMHLQCTCKSGKKFRDCHPDAKQGITEVRKMIYSGRINLSDYN
jgi:hypothetical protein